MNKVIVIVGAGDGIGKSTALHFGKKGFSVVVIARKKAKLEALCNELKEQNIDAHFFIGDAKDSDSLKDAFEQIWDKFEFIDVLHYNVAKVKYVNITGETSDRVNQRFQRQM